jgi:hypothetical protein
MSAQSTPTRSTRHGTWTTHGARSEVAVRRVATTEKRAFLRSNGLRLEELDAIACERLDAFVRLKAKVVLMDQWFDASGGFLDEQGEPKPAAKVYFLAANAAQRALDRLVIHLERELRDPQRELARYLEGNGERR